MIVQTSYTTKNVPLYSSIVRIQIDHVQDDAVPADIIQNIQTQVRLANKEIRVVRRGKILISYCSIASFRNIYNHIRSVHMHT